jgi:peptide/nickel transport system substrate-binding protein
MSGDSSIIDPGVTSARGGLEVANQIVDTLVTIDGDGIVHPGIATRWTIENDARKFTFTLRDDARFHDGTALDSSAVKRTFERIADPQTKSAQSASQLGPLVGVDIPDARTAVMNFKDPNPLLLIQIWKPQFGLLSPKQLAGLAPGELITAPIGSGPFKFGSKSADGVYTLQVNADYRWGPDILANRGAPYLDALRFRSIPTAATRVATLESGENVLIDDLPEPDYARLKSDTRFVLVRTPRPGLGAGFTFNVQKAPVSELAVRQAMNWAVDRQAIVDKVLFGAHRPCEGPLSEGVWGRLDDLEKTIPYAGDKKKAADLLQASGWTVGTSGIREKNGQPLSLVLATITGASPVNDLADALQLQVREVGIDLKVQRMPSANWLDFVRSYKHDLCDSAGANLDPDELRQRYHSSFIKSVNYANLADAQLDELLIRGQKQTLGSGERRQTYADIQRRLMDLMPMLSIVTTVRTMAMSTRVRGLTRWGGIGINAVQMTDPWLDT